MIDTLRQLMDPSKPSTCAKEIRNALRERFKVGDDKVTAANYLTFDAHWRDIAQILGREPSSYKITCVDSEFEGHGEVVGSMDDLGIISLYIARENGNHFVPLFKKKFARLS